jgi:archaellum biogenesis protein FlaJ (TadC family)
MGRWWSELNGTVRGFIVILLIAAIVFVLNLEGTLVSLSLILQIVFFLAIAVVLYMFWRDRMRHEVDTWSQRSRWVFYGSALLIILDFAAYFWPGRSTVGLDAFAFIVVLILGAYAMWRVWHAERTYGY